MLFPDLVIPVPLIPAENHCDPALLPDALQWVGGWVSGWVGKIQWSPETHSVQLNPRPTRFRLMRDL